MPWIDNNARHLAARSNDLLRKVFGARIEAAFSIFRGVRRTSRLAPIKTIHRCRPDVNHALGVLRLGRAENSLRQKHIVSIKASVRIRGVRLRRQMLYGRAFRHNFLKPLPRLISFAVNVNVNIL